MKSMTGYGRAQGQSSASSLEISIRTVNGRFLELRFHIPRELIPFESDLKKKLSQYFERGTVDVFINRKLKDEGLSSQLILNTDLAKKYHAAYKSLAKELKMKAQIQVETIARLPDVIKTEEAREVSAAEKKALMQAFEKACRACEAERLREGQSLQDELGALLGSLHKQVEQIQSLREEVNQNLLQRFEQRIRSRATGIELDSARLAQEVVLQIEKADINEELIRLREHIKNYRELLQTSEAQGKKLDFYTQELLREVNTIGSKSSVSQLTQVVVEAKTFIERLREQVQNVE
jgi:uncharacterized protein (TIGR00255 family)